MVALIADNPLRRHVLNKLIHPGVLPDRADGNAAGAVEARVLHEQVRRVRLGRDRVVAPGHVPPAESDVVRVEGVDAVCVLRRGLHSWHCVSTGGQGRTYAGGGQPQE